MSNRSDNFNRANSTTGIGSPSDGGSDWVEAANNWGIFSNKAYNASSAAGSISYLETSEADGTIQATAVDLSQSAILFRFSDTSNFWHVAVRATYFALYKMVAGSDNLVSGPTGAAAANDVISVVLSGSSITVKQNGSTVITFSDSFNATATKHGLYGEEAEASSDWDNWSFTGVAAAGFVRLVDGGLVNNGLTAGGMVA